MTATNKIATSCTISIAATTMLALSVFAVDVPIPSPAELGKWPSQVLLAAIALMAGWMAYKTWCKMFSLQEDNVRALLALTEKVGEIKEDTIAAIKELRSELSGHNSH